MNVVGASGAGPIGDLRSKARSPSLGQTLDTTKIEERHAFDFMG